MCKLHMSYHFLGKQVDLTFEDPNDLKGVELVSRELPSGNVEYVRRDVISVDLDLTELIIIDFNNYLRESNYYWALPELFRGNLVSLTTSF